VSRRLLLLNIALGLLGCLFAAGLSRALLAAPPLPAPPPSRDIRAALGPAAERAASAPAPASYDVIAAKNLFSPSRSEAQAGPVAAAGPRPLLHGVVMDGPKSRAYLEDPAVKRTFGYAVGDTVGGGRLEVIGVDRVVIGRSDGLLEVLLHDPAKPKAPPPAAARPAPAAAPSAGTLPPAGSTPAAVRARPPAAPVPGAPPSGALDPRSRVNER
jgi:hypothetical protein